ncbi:ras-related protein Rab-13-like [Dysidea avara]|uniref:ras-related protein Rab-13-like n=1 Tax=Dysidea avara TaxID=196820 RepID=UPI003329EAFD
MVNVSTSYDYLFKVVLCGDCGVGKTSMLCRFISDRMDHAYIATLGVDFKLTTLEMKGKTIKLQIWDTAGQERFKVLTTQYYRRAQGILLVYDITNEQSFENTANWLQMIQENAMSDVKMMLIANKTDVSNSRKVTTHQGKQLAKDYGMGFLETSAHTAENLSEAFSTVTESILKNMQNQFDEEVFSPFLSINKPDSYQKQESSCSC